MDGHREEVPLAEPLPHRDTTSRERKCCVELAAEPHDRRLDHREEALLHALGLLVQVPLRAPEPSGSDRRLSPQEVLDAQAQRAAGRPQLLA
jgi:hypothetical protein